ncbi:MAG: hypothetical protein IRZ28_18065 [Steroidobacteraceae bacterium]|nr:hypothetical protein [Steroidobacteraceae bacterium]
MSGPYQTALCALRRILAALETAETEERKRLVAIANETLATLEGKPRRLSTEALARRVAQLEAQLADREPGARRSVICERLGLSRSRYYELRAVRLTSDSEVLQGSHGQNQFD